eukprot:TRINITY_DN13111_c0_g1_i1.p1 TRINITY_DN13111_c0_g1~~TRINITY_DN13111_c0_g1_i1.p1  ORF type:complete len:304 (+),score=40.56 TRINITY_DN13111_c0_g1_i1:99-1010(+)
MNSICREYSNYFIKGDYNKASIVMTKALKICENNYEKSYCYSQRATAEARNGNYTLAKKDYTNSLAMNSFNWQGYCYRGFIYQILRDYERAYSDFNNAVTISANPKSFLYRAKFLKKCLHKREESFQDLLEAISILNKKAKKRDLKEHELKLRGVCYMNIKRYKLAIDDLTSAIDLGIENNYLNSDYYMSRSYCYYKQDQFEKANNDIKKAKELNPHDVSAHIIKGKIYYKQKQYIDSIIEFIQAIKSNPNQHTSYYYRSKSYLALNYLVLSKQDLEKSLSLNPHYYKAEYLLNTCNRLYQKS